MSETPKKTFGKYEAISHLGSGAMGVVWRAQDPVLGRTVAIKTISASLGSDNENKERFLREARAAAQLNHPNIITVFDFGQADNELYMAMELLEGKDLKELITGGALTFDQKLDIMEQVADGLAYAHGREVIHRDLKPGNIHVQPNGQVKILDFGLARLGSSDLTKTGVVMGTPNYMSPEQVMGERVDARSDVFSAGAVFYELLTNRKPFDAESVHATLYQVVHRDAPPPRQWDPRLPDEIVAIIETAMTKTVDGRYKNAGALRDAIRAFRYGEDPEVVEYEESGTDAGVPIADATAIAAPTPATTATGTQKASPFKSYGRSSSGSVPPSAGMPSAPYTTGRVPRAGSRPPSRPGGADPRSSSASIPPPPKQSNTLLIVGVLAVLVVGGVLLYGTLNKQNGNNAAQSSIDALTANLVETQLDLARRVLDDKDYKGAIDQTARILKLDPNNPEALGIREQAQSATREIETSVTAARDAVARGDSAQASAALERVMARDPKNPIVAELSSKLNANFSARAADARGEMEKAKTAAEAKEGASLDPAFSEAKKFTETAEASFKERQFTAATQTYLQARDAYDRARRAIENKERDAARATRTTTTAAATPAPAATVAAVVPGPTALPTLTLRPIPSDTATPLPTAAPTAAIVQTPVPAPSAAAVVPEPREFTTGRMRITAAETSGSKQPKGFDMSGVALLDFTGRFEFEVTPNPLIPGSPFRVRVFLKNEGKRDAKLDTLTIKITRNGEPSTPSVRILEDDIKVDQRPMVAEIPGSWVAGTRTWVMDVEALSKKGERYRTNLTMKPTP